MQNDSRKFRKDVFENRNADKGGLLDIDNSFGETLFLYHKLYERITKFLEVFSDSKECKKVLNGLYYDFVYNPSPNAFCRKIGAEYFIGLNGGLIELIHHIVFALCSEPTFLPDIGDPQVEVSVGGEFYERGFETKKQIASANDSLILYVPHRIPKSTSRKLLACFISELALEYVFLHELGHLMIGHLEKASDKEGNAFISELSSSDEILKRKEKQFFEYEADGFAILFSLCRNSMAPFFYSEQTTSIFRIHPKEMSYYCWYFAMCLVLRVFAQNDYTIHQYISKTHPHPQSRKLGNWMTLMLSKVVNSDPDKDRILDLCAKADYDLSNYWKQFRIPGYNYDSMLGNINQELVFSIDAIIPIAQKILIKRKRIGKQNLVDKAISDGLLENYGIVDYAQFKAISDELDR
jgi:hypothetical protein